MTIEKPEERREIPLAAATFKDLKTFAQDEMGLTVENGWNSATIKKALKEAGWENEFILSPAPVEAAPRLPDGVAIGEPDDGDDEESQSDEDADEDQTDEPIFATIPAVRPKKVKEPMYTVEISETDGAGGKRPYYVGVNGVGLLLPRNRPIQIKRRYVEAIKSAKQHTMMMNEETNTMEPRTISSLPMQILESPTKTQIAAWVAWESYVDLVEHKQMKDAERRIRAEMAAHQ